MKEVVQILVFIVCVVLVLGMILLQSMKSINELTFEADVAEIEQLRADAAVVDPQQAEDVIGQVVATNQKIVSLQSLNDGFLGIAIPDGWENVEVIPVPQ